MDTTVRFQFSDKFGSTNTWFEKLKLKMKESENNGPKYAFTFTSTKFKQWEIIYNPKTRQVKGLKFLKIFQSATNELDSVLFDEQKQELLYLADYWDQIGICNLKTGENQTVQHYSIPSVSSCMCWYILDSKRVLIVGRFDGIIEFWDWETKQLIKLEKVNSRINNFSINKHQELLAFGVCVSVDLFCLKTFTCKNLIQDSTLYAACFLDEKRSMFAYGDTKGNITLQDKYIECKIHTQKAHCHKIKCLLYSHDLDLLISCDKDNIKVWKIIGETRENTQLQLHFEIFQSSNFDFSNLSFLDPGNQTHLFIDIYKKAPLVIDLLLKKVIQ